MGNEGIILRGTMRPLERSQLARNSPTTKSRGDGGSSRAWRLAPESPPGTRDEERSWRRRVLAGLEPPPRGGVLYANRIGLTLRVDD
jgi:hypothetical protein